MKQIEYYSRSEITECLTAAGYYPFMEETTDDLRDILNTMILEGDAPSIEELEDYIQAA